MLSIPADASWKKSARTTSRVVLIERSLDTPIVRHIQLAPCGIVKVWLFSSSRIAFEKEPIGIKGGNEASRGRRTRHDSSANGANYARQTSKDNYGDKTTSLLQTMHLSLSLLPIQYWRAQPTQ